MKYIALDIAKANNLTDAQTKKLVNLETTTSRLRGLIAEIQSNLNFTLEYLDEGNHPYTYPVSVQHMMDSGLAQAHVLMAAENCLDAGIPGEIVTQVTKYSK